MKTIEQHNLEQGAPATDSPAPERTTDSMMWLAPQPDSIAAAPAKIVVPPTGGKLLQRQQASLQRQIFLTIVPFIIVPIGLGGWLGLT